MICSVGFRIEYADLLGGRARLVETDGFFVQRGW